MEKLGLEKPIWEKIDFWKWPFRTIGWGRLPPTPPATILQKRFSENRFWKTVFGKPFLENRFSENRFLEAGFWKTVFWKPVFGNRFLTCF